MMNGLGFLDTDNTFTLEQVTNALLSPTFGAHWSFTR